MARNYPVFEKYLLSRIPYTYTDELRLFLVKSLRQVPYLKDIQESVLIEIAFNMEVEYSEPGTKLLDTEQNYDQTANNEMMIVYSGTMTCYVIVDD